MLRTADEGDSSSEEDTYVLLLVLLTGKWAWLAKKWAWLTKIFAGANAPVHLSLHSYLRGWQLW